MTQVANDPQSVELLAEAYRERLGFLPWIQQRNEHAIVEHGRLRRQGRTTQAILKAIAFGVVHPDKLSVVMTPSHEVEAVRRRVRDLARQLDVNVSNVHVRSYRDVVEGRGGNWHSPSTHRICDDLDASLRPDERLWIKRAYDAGLMSRS